MNLNTNMLPLVLLMAAPRTHSASDLGIHEVLRNPQLAVWVLEVS